MQLRPVRIGIIGVGFGAAVHIPAFQSEGHEVGAICARRGERAKEVAERFGIPHSFTDYRELLNLSDLDAVSIAAPPAMHHPITIAALEAGKHVLCEKPFSTNSSLASDMLGAARRSGLTCMIAHEFRFASARARVKELIEEGYLGPLQFVLIRLLIGPRRPRRPAPFSADRDIALLGGGMLWALGSHYLDCLRHWFGEIQSVTAEVFNDFPQRVHPGSDEAAFADADDGFAVTLHFVGGGRATMIASTSAPFGSGTTIEIYGRDGTLVTPQTGLNPPAHGALLGAKIGEESLTEITIPERLEPFADARDDRLMPFRLLVRQFVQGINEGRSPAPNFYDGLRCQQVLDAVRESSRTGQRVFIH